MQPGVDYGKENRYPLEGAENDAPRPVPIQVVIEGHQPGATTKPDPGAFKRRFCASCGSLAGGMCNRSYPLYHRFKHSTYRFSMQFEHLIVL